MKAIEGILNRINLDVVANMVITKVDGILYFNTNIKENWPARAKEAAIITVLRIVIIVDLLDIITDPKVSLTI